MLSDLRPERHSGNYSIMVNCIVKLLIYFQRFTCSTMHENTEKITYAGGNLYTKSNYYYFHVLPTKNNRKVHMHFNTSGFYNLLRSVRWIRQIINVLWSWTESINKIMWFADLRLFHLWLLHLHLIVCVYTIYYILDLYNFILRLARTKHPYPSQVTIFDKIIVIVEIYDSDLFMPLKNQICVLINKEKYVNKSLLRILIFHNDRNYLNM